MDAEAAAALADDPDLEPLVERHGPLALETADDDFRRLVTAIVNQQVSTASARAIRERLFDAVEVTPEAVLDADPATLREVGLSRQKTDYVRSVAEAYRERDFGAAHFEGMADEAVLEELTDVRGVGSWTGKMYLLFCLGRPDVFPVEDLGVRRGMVAVCGVEDRAAMVDRAERWRPFRSYAALYLWRAHD
jgi:DNA-3-methyladenine glycosylase II